MDVTKPENNYDTRFRFKEGERVKLRGDVHPVFYQGYGCVGNEGWVKARRLDNFGYPQIFVQWDSDHWSWNGTPDMWTWEGHFDKVDESMSEEEDRSLAKDLIEFLQTRVREPESTPAPKNELERAQDESRLGDYKKSLAEAMEAASRGEAFAIVTVVRREHEGAPGGILMPLAFVENKTPEAGILVNNQISTMAAQSHEAMALAILQGLIEGKDE